MQLPYGRNKSSKYIEKRSHKYCGKYYNYTKGTNDFTAVSVPNCTSSADDPQNAKNTTDIFTS